MTEAEAHAHSHTDVSGGWLRAAVFGAMDGLVTNTALVAGLGAAASSGTVILGGVAGLVAGAVSMALGEWTSVSTQNEQLDLEVNKERHELRVHPVEERAELVEMWHNRGLDRELAVQVAEQLSRDPEQELREHARAELGLDPEEKPSPWTAAGSSFVLFALGALLPLLPYLFGYGEVWAAVAVGGIGLFVAGVLSARFTERPWWSGGSRQLIMGLLAAGLTYLIGSWIGIPTG
ncbi:MAG: VIT1/CCC1 transporter family protein [Geodermatophilaceae bacterium]|nr:VIT1/CCC1 transporter family protein [Geodermatophilaceae bacterium]